LQVSPFFIVLNNFSIQLFKTINTICYPIFIKTTACLTAN